MCKANLGLNTTRNELIQNINEYLDHPDDEISGLAHLSFLVVPGYEFLVTPKFERLGQFESLLDQHFENVAKSNDCLQKLAELIVLVYKSNTLPDETRQFFSNVIQRFKSDTSDSGKRRFKQLQEQFYFGRLDLPTMVDRVSSRRPTVDADVNAFVSALEEFPNASLAVHQLFLDIIREYIRQDRKNVAQQLIERIETKILPNIADEDDRQKVREAADEFKPFL